MKKIINMVMIFSMLLWLVGCTKNLGEEESENENQNIISNQNETQEFLNISEVEEEILGGKNLSSWNSIGSLVKVETKKHFGNGVIWEIKQKEDVIEYYIVTAAHVFENEAEPTQVMFFDGAKANAYKYVCDESTDLAIVKVLSSDFIDVEDNKEENKYSIVNRIDIGEYDSTKLERDDIVYALDFYPVIDNFQEVKETEVSINVILGLIIDPWIDVSDFGQYMIYARMSAHDGMSGGGLYDEDENLLGILCGMGDESDIVAMPVSMVWACYSQYEASL